MSLSILAHCSTHSTSKRILLCLLIMATAKKTMIMQSVNALCDLKHDYSAFSCKVHPDTPWQYALYLKDDKQPEADLIFQQVGGDLKNISHLFDPFGVPTKILAKVSQHFTILMHTVLYFKSAYDFLSVHL